MNPSSWETSFRSLHQRACAAWAAGHRSPETLFTPQDAAFLASIGCTPQELFDFVDDLQLWGEPDLDTVLAVQRIRYRYFMDIQKGQPSPRVARMEDLPPKDQAIDGIPWLPRIIEKARLKLRGEMPPDLMYGCGGDRPFLASVHQTLPGFLELVRDAGDDTRRIVDAVTASARQ